MWEQKKVNTPQVFDPNQSQSMTSYPPQSGMSQNAQSMGPPPPYTAYPQLQPQMYYTPQQAHEYAKSTQMGYIPANYGVGNQSLPQGAVGAVGGYYQSVPTNAYPTHPYSQQYQYNPFPQLPPNSTVVMPQGFDAGARFDGVSKPNIPPPPPGVAPNAAQLAQMQGQNLVIGQKKGSFFAGGSSGGYTFW